ncbi:MAG: O-antigen ligase family protein [Bacteroidales bacterium]
MTYYNLLIRLNYFTGLVFSFLLPFGLVINRYILAVFIISGLLSGLQNFRNLLSRKNIFLILTSVLFLLYLISVLYSQNKEIAFFHIQKRLTLFFFPLVFAVIPLRKRHKNIIFFAFVAGVFVASVICFGNFIYQLLSDNSFAQGFYDQPLGQFYSTFYIFDHSSYYAAYLVFSIIILSGLLKDNIFLNSNYKPQIKIVAIFFIFVFALLTFLISSRAGLIGLVVIAFVIAYQNFTQIKIRIILYSVLILLSLVIFTNKRFIDSLGIIDEIANKEDFDEKTIKQHSAIRLVLWKASFDVIKDNVLLGVGTGDVREELEDKIENTYNFKMDRIYNPHNQFLSTFAATGVFGFLSLVGIFVIAINRAFIEKNTLLLNLVILLFIHFLFESMMGRLNGVLFFSFFISALFYYFDDFTKRV